MICSCARKIVSAITFRHIQYFLIAAALAFLIFAYIAEYKFHILPCDFCLYERGVYAGVIAVGILSLTTRAFGSHRGIFAQLLALSVGIALTFYHVGVEQHWWTGPLSCMGPGPAATLEEFRAQLMKVTRPRCDQINWVLFGVSATLWNLMIQGALAFLTSLGLYLPNRLESR